MRDEADTLLDTLQDTSAPDSVRALMDAALDGQPVERTVLVSELERMLSQVARTDGDFDQLVLLVQREQALTLAKGGRAPNAHAAFTLPDGTAIIHTTWTFSQRRRAVRAIAKQNGAWLGQHEDRQGVPCFRASQLEIARAAASYQDALYILGDGVKYAAF